MFPRLALCLLIAWHALPAWAHASGQDLAVSSAAGAPPAAAVAAGNVDFNNRQLHPTERQRIQQLAAGDPRKEARLAAAACYLVRCADGVPPSDPNYPALLALQNTGAGYTEEQNLLKGQTAYVGRNPAQALFTYDWWDAHVADPASANKLVPRAVGTGQAVVGGAGALVSLSTCVSVATCGAAQSEPAPHRRGASNAPRRQGAADAPQAFAEPVAADRILDGL